MSESEKWLTVREFARIVGLSPQAIYKQLTTDSTRLSTYVKTENRCKYIRSDALRFWGLTTDLTDVDNQCSPSCQPNQLRLATNSTSKNGDLQQELDRIRAQLVQVTADLDAARAQRDKAEIKAAAAEVEKKRADTAEAQCHVKDQQLADQLKAKDEQISSLTAALMAAQQQATDLTAALTAAQALHAGTIQERLSEQSSISGESDSAVIQDNQSATEDLSEKKRGFFSRLFGKK